MSGDRRTIRLPGLTVVVRADLTLQDVLRALSELRADIAAQRSAKPNP